MTRHHGWVNQFEGDAALCVFGAPEARPDAAARALAHDLAPLPVRAAAGVGAGPVVAGHVGTESRFEDTVIGDAVNVAARLSELAKGAQGRVLADAAMVALAGSESAEWDPCGDAVLRGRSTTTQLAHPH